MVVGILDGEGWNLNVAHGMFLWDWFTLGLCLVGSPGLAIATGAWLNTKLGGHTGDTYGAVVEWTEMGTLVLFTLLR